MTNEQIKEIALANGFKLKEQPNGDMDLNPYVYDFARALLDSRWISVKDRLPDNEEFYLTYLFDGNSDTWEMQIKWWDKKHGFLPWDLIDDVTHWQKLPEPPEGVGHE